MNHLGQRVLGIKAQRVTCSCGKTDFRGIAGCIEDGGELDCTCTSALVKDCEPFTKESPEWPDITPAFGLDERDHVTEFTVQLVDGDEELWDYWFVLEEL